MLEEECPYCRQLVYGKMSDHITLCPSLVTKRSPQVTVPPGRPEYVEGELPPHLKEVLRRKGSFLTEAEREVE